MFWSDANPRIATLRVYDAAERRTYDYAAVSQLADHVRSAVAAPQKRLVLLLCDNSVHALASYVGLLRSGHAVMLADAQLDNTLKARLIDVYRPEFLVSDAEVETQAPNYERVDTGTGRYSVLCCRDMDSGAIHPDTAVLLSTSGTTGSPKLVRLSYKNIDANAESIVCYLGITSDETAITSLPFSYSYGLSVIHSHLRCGAKIVCTNESIVQEGFWSAFKEQQCTSLAGVPFHYQMLERLRFERMNLPSLKTMTQAGGRLPVERIDYFRKVATSKGYRFFVMYGQTEATARISFVPWDRLEEKRGSVGVPVPGGTIRIERDGSAMQTPGETGEVVYSGPNVMQGYAEERADLGRGDELRGMLRTGDMGYLDHDGYLFITGRLKRFLKIFGQRLNLDDVEKMLESRLNAAVGCVGSDDAMVVLVEGSKNGVADSARALITELYGIHPSAVAVRCVPSLPRTSVGKKNYDTMKAME